VGIGLVLFVLVGGAFAFARIEFNGANLADLIASYQNGRMRGRMELGSVEWRSGDLAKVVTGGWIDITVRDVRVWDDCALGTEDPEALRLGNPNEECTPDDNPDPIPGSKKKPRKLLLWTPEITAQLDIHALLFGSHEVVLRHVTLHGGEALIEQTREPYPLTAYNRTSVTIMSAIYSRMKAGFRAGIYAETPPPIVDLRDIHIVDVNLTVHVNPTAHDDGTVTYGMAARLEHVDVAPDPDDTSAYVYLDGRDPLVQKFYFHLGVHAAVGHVRLLDKGPRSAFRIARPDETHFVWGAGRDDYYDLEVRDVDLRRLAQVPTDWAHYNFIANSLELDGTIHTIPCDGGKPEDGATIHIGGGLIDYWDRPYDGQWSIQVAADHLGATVRTCIKKTVGGDNLGGTITVSGPFVALPRIALDMHDLDVDIPLSATEDPIRLTLAKVQGWIDLVNDQGAIDQTKAVVPNPNGGEPGEALVSATFQILPTLNAQAELDITKPIDVGRFLPKQVAGAVGTLLTGNLKVSGDVEDGVSIHNFELALGPTARDRVAKISRGDIFAKNDFDYIELHSIYFEANKTTATIVGRIVYDKKLGYVAKPIDIYPVSGDLDYWLKRLGLPLFAQRAGGPGKISVTGPLTGPGPVVSVTTTLTGVPCLDNLEVVNATIAAGIVNFHVTSTGLGGTLDGKGSIDTNSKPSVIRSLQLNGAKLDGSKLCGTNGIVQGTIDSVDAFVSGSINPARSAIDWASLAKIYANAQHVSVKGEALSDLNVCLNRTDPRCSKRTPSPAAAADCTYARTGGACVVATATRDAGGELDATIANVPAVRTGRGTVPAHLGGNLLIDDVPMAVLDPWVGAGTMGGLLSANLDLSGQVAPTFAPQASGTISLLRSWVERAFVGDSQLRVDPITIGTRMPGIQVRGTLMSGRVEIFASLGTEAPYPVDVQVTAHRLEVDQFVDLSKALHVTEPLQAWASGTVSLHTELQPLSGKPATPEAWVEITELEGIFDHTSRDGRRVPLRVALVEGAPGQYAMSLRVTPTTIELACRDPGSPGGRKACPAQLATPAGIVSIEGHATATQMNLTAKGELDLSKLAPLLENQLDDIHGTLALDGEVTGTVSKPSWSLELAVKDGVAVRPAGSDTDLEVVPGAKLSLANGTLSFDQLALRVPDEQKAAGGALNVRGSIGLDGLQPATWNVKIDGDVPAKLLTLTSKVSQASGAAHIDGAIALTGTGKLPTVNGAIAFDSQTPFAIVPRDVRHELALVNGRLEIATNNQLSRRSYTLTIADTDRDEVRMTIDSEGLVDHIHGRLTVREDGTTTEAELGFDAQNVPYHNPDRTLDLTMAADDVDVRLRNDGTWIVNGDVAIVAGKYVRNFDLTQNIKAAAATSLPTTSLWEKFPALGDARLNLTLDVRRFAFAGNIANIDFIGHGIEIAGSPRDPRISGSIVVVQGPGFFQIPLTRAKFTNLSGSIDFAANERATNPRLEIAAEVPSYTDLSGQQHQIKATITGTLEQPLWDLSTNTGLDKSQTLSLLVLGRSADQLRRSLGDQVVGGNPTAADPSTNPSTGFGDELVKDLAGDWITSLLGPSIARRLQQYDLVLRPEVGFGTVGVHAEFKARKNLSIIGDGEETVRGQNYNASLVLRTPYRLPWISFSPDDRLRVEGTVLEKLYSDPADQAQNIQDAQLKLVYRLFIP